MNKQEMKKLLEENFDYLQGLSVREYTLYRKWVDLQLKYPVTEPDAFFDDQKDQYTEIQDIKNCLYQPKRITDYLDIQPKMVLAKDKDTNFIWNTLRHFCHSASWKQSPGRLLRYYVIDEPTNTFLGFISLGSDFIGVGGRDAFIGWSTEDKLKGGRLRHTAMGSSIAAVQPFGFNYNGGKLMALLTASDVVQDEWKSRYNDDLVGVTTTSLYGGGSMYNRLKHWRKCKSTTGQISLEPAEDVYKILKKWYKETFPEVYKKAVSGSHPKTRLLGLIYKELGVKPPINNAPRGCYWNELFDNTKDFLCRRTDILGEKKYDNSVDTLTQLWKDCYAKKRIKNLLNDNRVSSDVLFYDDMITNDWVTIKNNYLSTP